MEHRTGENGPVPFRTSRIFNIGMEWYFAKREDNDCGPFENKRDAEAELSLYLNHMAKRDLQ